MVAVLFLQSPYQNARDARYALRAFVEHRIVGTLPSARRAFGLIAGDAGRSASSHFGIGYVNGALAIDQYVPLDRMAWTNGDVRNPSWSRIIAGVNPNLYTVTIEHEDGGYPGQGVISDEVWRASMELQALLVSGDAAAIRAAGIRGATDAIVRQMAAIPKDAAGFIDHHQIAGPNKPYCLRGWLEDLGFVAGEPSRRDRLLARLTGTQEEPDVPTPPLTYVPQIWKAGPEGTHLRREPIMVKENVVDTVTAETFIYTVAESKDGVWRLGVADDVTDPDGEGLYWMVRGAMRPVGDGRDPELRSAIADIVNAKIEGKPLPTGDGLDVEAAIAAALAKAEKPWREWLAAAPAP